MIRVKKVFPMQPAWESGQFQEGDILIGAGGQALSGLTLRQVNTYFTKLMSSSCHFDRASNVKIGVECQICQIFYIIIF